MRRLDAIIGIVVASALPLPACHSSSAAKSPPPISPACAELVDASIAPRAFPDVRIAWRIDDGAPGYEYQSLLQIDRAGMLRFVDVKWSEPGPNGLSDRTKSPNHCFSRRISDRDLAALEAVLEEHHLCAQTQRHADPDISPNIVIAHTGKLDCEVALDHLPDEMTDDGRAIYHAIEALSADGSR